MGRTNRDGKLRSKKVKASDPVLPRVWIDSDSDFASIKIGPGIEAKSYLVDGIVFCEDKKGRIIEIQVLNLSQLQKLAKTA